MLLAKPGLELAGLGGRELFTVRVLTWLCRGRCCVSSQVVTAMCFSGEHGQGCFGFCLPLQKAIRRKGERDTESLRLLSDRRVDGLARPSVGGLQGSQKGVGAHRWGWIPDPHVTAPEM